MTKIIAEISANHNHNFVIAKQTILAAKAAGADFVKLQTYTPDTITIDCSNEYFRINQGTIWDGKTLYKLYQEAYTPWEWHEELFNYGRELGIEVFSTPFDFTSVDFLEELHTPIYKIASFEITDIPLIEYVASKGKPVIISTGIGTINEIEEAVSACRAMGNNDITLLQCTSEYPAKEEEANLATMIDLKERFDVRVGLSDHTTGMVVAKLAVAMGADIIEKHFILDRSIGGPDSSFSMVPCEFKKMVSEINKVQQIVGHVSYEISKQKEASRTFSRSLFVVEDVKSGSQITESNVKSIRPGYGLSPKYLKEILGRKFLKDIKKGTPLNWEMFDKD